MADELGELAGVGVGGHQLQQHSVPVGAPRHQLLHLVEARGEEWRSTWRGEERVEESPGERRERREEARSISWRASCTDATSVTSRNQNHSSR